MVAICLSRHGAAQPARLAARRDDRRGLRPLARAAAGAAAIFRAARADLECVAELIEKGEDTTANLALLGDKNLLFNKERTACIMFQSSGSSWVAMGDPIGPPQLGEALAWEFLEDCDGMAVSPVVLSSHAGTPAAVRGPRA